MVLLLVDEAAVRLRVVEALVRHHVEAERLPVEEGNCDDDDDDD